MKNILHSFSSSILLVALLFGTGFSNSRLRAQPPCHPDFDALMALYNSTNGANWTNKTGWEDGAAGTDCDVCNWYGVGCDNGRVVTLNLQINNLTGPLPTEIGDLTMLSYLSMLGNQLSGNIPATIGNLTNLGSLELSENQLTGAIPASLGNLSNLYHLQLNQNQLTGSIPVEIGNLTSLGSLYFQQNQLSGTIPAAIGNLPNLNYLSLNENQLTGSIPIELGNLTEIVTLELNDNLLSGSIPAELSNLVNLGYLFLSNNDLSGCLPVELLNLCAQGVNGDISGNPNLDNEDWTDFCATQTGVCGGSCHPDFHALMALYNSTDGANWTDNTGWADGAAGTDCNVCAWAGVTCNNNDRVSVLNLQYNNLTGSLPGAIGNLSQVQYLYLRGNNLSGSLPAGIGNLAQVEILYLDQNNFSGTIPASMENLDNLLDLSMNTNQFSGPIPPALGDMASIVQLNIVNNQLSGDIPPELGNLTTLQVLGLSGNMLTGEIPPNLISLSSLAGLSLSNNQLTGNIPSDISSNLYELYLDNNNLSGDIPATWSNFPNLGLLSLQHNQLSGSIPAGLGDISNLYQLDLSANQLTGTIPAELGGLSNLYEFNLSNNDLSGCLPPELLDLCVHVAAGDISNNPNLDNDDWADFCATQAGACGACTHPDYAALMALYNSTNGANWTNNTGWADGAAGTDCDVCDWHGVFCNGNGRVAQLYLYANNLVGTIPAEIGDLTSLYELDLSGNHLSGLLSTPISHLGGLNLTYLNLAENLFTGPIPAEIGNFTALSSLTLASNPLSGSIPPEIGSLTNMGYLNLYANQLTGALPPELGNLTNLVVLGLFNNQLSGCIPASYTVFCSNGTSVNLVSNPGLPGGGDFAAFCANGAGADADADGYCAGTGPADDCDDANDAIYPGATEICNGVDDDCDGQTDEGYCLIEFSGTILWEHDDVSGVKDANVKLTGSATASDLTDINGAFLIATTETTGSFTLKPTKNINKFNGVTSADAVAIQQHVTQYAPITDPYKLVCADVNKNNAISTLDAALILQALLGNPQANNIFNTSWRFVPSSHTMQTPPWGFPEQRTYSNISAPQTDQDFIGMKIGDVTAAYANPANFGAGEPMVLRVKDQTLMTGEVLDVSFTADQLNDLAAFQCALTFDPTQLQFEAIEPAGGLPLTTEHFGTYKAGAGEIRAVWSQATGLGVEEAAPVFRLRFTALQSGAKLSDVLQLDEAVLSALAYTGNLAESKVKLAFSEATGTNDPEAVSALQLQVWPNPFQVETTVAFTLPAAGEAQLRVLDVNGLELLRINNMYPAGRHSEKLRLGSVTASGVLTCELITPFGVVTRKVVLARL